MLRSVLQLFLALLLLITAQDISQVTYDPLYIFKISNINKYYDNSAYGGLFGGTKVNIYGFGFDQIPQNNLVLINYSPCTVIQTSYEMITCITGPFATASASQVYINVAGKEPFTCTDCYFTYSYSLTPFLDKIYPRSSSFNSRVLFIGNHQVFLNSNQNSDFINSLKIGESTCITDSIYQYTYQDYSKIICDVTNEQGGYYNVSSWLLPGYSKKAQSMLVSSLYFSSSYQYIINPIVLSVSSHSGASTGNKLSILGSGFSSDSSKIQVKVAGLPCKIFNSSVNKIQCDVAQNFDGNTYVRLQTNSSQQKNGFISGSGFTRQVYDVQGNQNNNYQKITEIDKFINHYLNKSNAITKMPSSNFSTRPIVGQLQLSSAQLSDLYNFNGGQSWYYYLGIVTKGYFVAPRTGTYKFNLFSIENLKVYVSKVKGSEEIDYSQHFLQSFRSQKTNYVNSEYIKNQKFIQLTNSSLSSSIYLTAGQSIYMEIFSVSEYFSMDSTTQTIWSLNLQMLNVDPDPRSNYVNTLSQIQKIEFVVDEDPEVFVFEHIGATQGYYEYSYSQDFYDKKVIKFNASKEQFYQLLTSYHFFNYKLQVKLETYDYNSVLTDQSGNPAYKYKYIVTIFKRRYIFYQTNPYYSFNIKNYNVSNAVNNTIPSANSYQQKPPSPQLSGTFKVLFNGKYLRYSSQADPQSFSQNMPQKMLQQYFFLTVGSFIKVKTVDLDNYKSFIIYFEGIKGNVPQIEIDSSLLTGGKEGSVPYAKVTTIREGSSNLFFEPIVSEFLRTSSNKPSVQVKVNGVLSQCGGDCSYQIISESIPKVISASLTSNIVTFALDTNVATPYEVTFAGQPCTYLSGTHSDYKCTLPKHSNGDPIIEAGLYLPKVLIPNKGYAKYLDTLNKIDVPLAITSLTPNTGSPNGGMVTQISGKGFPISSDRTFTLKQCDIDVRPISVSNDLISFYSVECTAGTSTNVKLTFNLKEATSAFTYTSTSSIKISSITPASHSPVLKGFMTVTGEGFGTDRSLLRAWLTLNNANVYQLNVLESSDTTLKLKIPGGESGVFKVKVLRTDIGYASVQTADANKFIYGIFVDSISPLVGSKFGGTIITIIGDNFSTELTENQVYIGDAINQRCEMLTATKTQITCRTPALHPSYTVVEQNVTVVGRAMIDSECRGECKFSYDNVTFPTINFNSNRFQRFGKSITFSGTNLKANGNPPKVFIGQKEAIVTSSSMSSVTFIYPSLYFGKTSMNVYVDGVGYATEPITIFTQFAVFSPLFSGSTEGNIISILGSGFLPFGNQNFIRYIENTNNIKYQFIETGPSEIKINIGKCNNGEIITFAFNKRNINYQSTKYTCSSASTPIVILKSNNEVSFNSVTQIISFNQTVSSIVGTPESVVAYLIDINNERFGKDILLTVLTNSGSQFTVDGSILASGKYKFKVFYSQRGYAVCSNTLLITEPSVPTVISIQSGYNGGPEIKVTGSGLNLQSKLIIGKRVEAQIDKLKSTSSQLYYKTPQYLQQLSNQAFKLLTQFKLQGEFISDKQNSLKNAFDNMISTKFNFSSGGYLGLDLGKIKQAVVTKIKYLLNQADANKTIGMKISGSNDKLTWTQIDTIGQYSNGGWNTWISQIISFSSYRYIAIKSSIAQFSLSQLQFYGYFVSEPLASLASNSISIDLTNGYYTHSSISQIEYKYTLTPIVTTLSKRFGTPLGGDSLTITGTNFGTDSSKVKVIIDGVECVVQTTTDTSITCTTGKRDTMPPVNTFAVSVNQNLAVVKSDSFTYGYRWSDEATWGGDFPPVEGDTVYVPEGMVLIVDQSTPKLQLILVEGTIIFADESAITVQAEIILVVRGKLVAGTESQPYQNQLKFILTGNYYARQLPQFGNKVIGCYNCIFDMHGRKRNVVWTQLSETTNAGSNQIKLTTAVDWEAGEQIVLASTSYEHSEAEQKTIAAIDATKKIITLTDALKYSHKSTSQMYGNKNIALRGQVGLLSRNIKIQGHSDSSKGKYGAHLMMYGTTEKGLISKIQYTEFSDCGQQQTLKYCIFFNKNNDLTKSLVKGNSIHHSYARAIALKASSYLTIDNNVAYLTAGHSIFLETGTQQYNVIQNNLIISTVKAYTLYQTDISPSSFYITNPLNTLKNNRAAGSDGNGISYFFRYPVKSSRLQFVPIKNSQNNIAHSNQRSGLRISRNFPSSIKDWTIKNTFENYQLWNNKQYGVYSHDAPNTIFNNFIVVNFRTTGININHNSQNCSQSVTVSNSIIASSVQNQYSAFTGFYSSNSPNYLTNITFCNFGNSTTLIALPTFFQQNQNVNYLKQISTVNISGRYISNSYYGSSMIKIEDTSFSVQFDGVSRTSSTLLNAEQHNNITGKCFYPTVNDEWPGFTMCNPNVEILFVVAFSAPYYYIHIKRINDDQETIPKNQYGNFPTIYSNYYSSYQYGYHASFIGGYTYSIWPSYRTEIERSYISTGCVSPPLNGAIVLRYNFSNTYESIKTIVDGQQKVSSSSKLNKSTCSYGDFYYTKRYLFICISARGWKSELKIEIVPVLCQVDCPPPIDYDAEIDIFCPDNVTALNWSNTLIWRKGRIPIAGQNVTVPHNCSIIMDVDVENLNVLMIDGVLTVKDENRVLSAKFIWVKGTLQAGTKEQAFQNNFSIKLLGARLDPTFVIDQNIGWGKSLVVTGKLYLYGITPTTTYTKLTSNANVGDTTINVQSTAGWAVGQTLGISPSFSNYYEYEKVTIASLTATSVTFTPALSYAHYGNSTPLINSYGELDMRSIVGVFDRNIKIIRDDDAEQWGYSVLVYGWRYSNVVYSGSAVFNAVQFQNGGQFASERAALNVINTVIGNTSTFVTNSVFENCFDYCMYLRDTKNLKIENNFLFEGQRFLIYAERTEFYVFKSNVMIGARNRSKVPTGENIACYNQYYNYDVTNITVQDNICQGSQGSGFIIPWTSCGNLNQNTGYVRNTAGSANIGFVLSHQNLNYGCKTAGYLRAYGCNIGITSNPYATTVVWDRLMLADNKRSLGLRFGGENQNNNSLFLTNSWISAVSRPECELCYSDGKTSCSDSNALRLLVVGKNDFVSIDDSVQSIQSTQDLDGNAWIYNTTFTNFQLNYSTAFTNSLSTRCFNNRLFEVHPSADSSIGNHHFFNTSCTNCHDDSIGYFASPIESNLGWQGGCGTILCTGRSNYLMLDHDGSLIGHPGTIVPSNPEIGSLPNCVENKKTNGHVCNRTDIGRLKFSSIAKDYRSRIMWPVNLTNQDSNLTTTINAWRETSWNGGEPSNRRYARFLSLVQFGHCYNISFAAQPPSDMLFSFSLPKLEGDNSKWICIKMYYPVPNSISVTYSSGAETKSIISTSSESVTDYPNLCGTHKYFYKESVIHFIVTGGANCQARVTLTSSVQVTARLSVEVSTFYENNGAIKFLDLISAFLNITTNRLKIVGVYSGSTVVDFTISPQLALVEASTDVNPSAPSVLDDLKNLASKMSTAGSSVIPQLLSVTTVITAMDQSGQPVPVDPVQPQTSADGLATRNIIIGVVVAGVLVIICSVAVFLIVKKVRAFQLRKIYEQKAPERLDGSSMNINGNPGPNTQNNSSRHIENTQIERL